MTFDEKNTKKSVQAESGKENIIDSVSVLYEKAQKYEKGIGVDVDENLAFSLYTKCAEMGSADAMYRLGAYYESKHMTYPALNMYSAAEAKGHSIAAQRAAAMRAAIEKAENLLKLAQSGDSKSQFMYAQCCEEGKGVEINAELAFSWYLTAAKAGNIKAQYKVGQCLEQGLGVKKNPLQAVEWYECAANSEKPYSVAYYRLYELYNEGTIVERDEQRAKSYLINSANYGYTVAALLTAKSYENGTNGFLQNIPEAVVYYIKAAECNNNEAKAHISNMLERAEENDPEALYFAFNYYLKKNKGAYADKAEEYLHRSAAKGYPPAMERLGIEIPPERDFMHNLQPAELPAEEKSKVELLEAKAENGDMEAAYEAGCIYRDCAKRERHNYELYKKAVEWFGKASEAGSAKAKFELASCIGKGYGTEQSYEKAFKLFQDAYEGGDIRALTSMGVYYLRGRYVGIDKAKALACFEKAAQASDPEAEYRLGKYYASHDGSGKLEYAFELCKKAALAGHAKAQFFVGVCCENGSGTEQNPTEALRWYRTASENGLAAADYAIAFCYETGKGVEKNTEKAFELYLDAAKRDNASAQFKVACMYEHGTGTNEDPHEALQWYEASAAKGNYKALHALGNCYEAGIGTTKDMSKAVNYYERAANHGNSWSQYRLAVYYTSGIYTEKNPSEALRYCKTAAENKSAFAQYRLGRWYEKGYIVEQDMRKAVSFYRQAAEQGNPAAQCALGICCEEGAGTQKNITEAVILYGKSAYANYAPALYRLGLCCETGYGMEQDVSEALFYYERAAALGYAQAEERIAALLA